MKETEEMKIYFFNPVSKKHISQAKRLVRWWMKKREEEMIRDYRKTLNALSKRERDALLKRGMEIINQNKIMEKGLKRIERMKCTCNTKYPCPSAVATETLAMVDSKK